MKPAPCPGCDDERVQTFHVEGLDCAAEVATIEGQLARLPGVCSVRASAATGRATVVHTLAPGRVERALKEAGFRVREAPSGQVKTRVAAPTVIAAVLTAAGFTAAFWSTPAAVLFYLPAIVVGGAGVARVGILRARQGTLDMNALMTVAVAGAMAIGEWGEGATTIVLFSFAQWLESRSLERARRAITGLMALAPDMARVRRGGDELDVPAEEVARGEKIIVGPGGRVPLDGTVETGLSEVDQSPLTGESRPVQKSVGDTVFAGSINGPGALEVCVTRGSSETTLARILRRVEEAQASRAASQGFVEAFARVYTPVVLVLALLTVTLPPLLGMGDFEGWGYRALVLLVIACPCALVISTPVSIVSALTAASRRGVLVKGGAHLEQLGQVRVVVFDKTGTLTLGVPEVTDLLPLEGSARDVLTLAGAVEARSAHPLGAAIVARASREGISLEAAQDVAEVPGRGVRGRVGDKQVLVGSHRFFDEEGLCDHRLDAELRRLEGEGKTAMLVGAGDGTPKIVGALAVADVVRPAAASAIETLRLDGLRVVMLTGDNALTARAIAERLSIEDHRAELLPEDKVAHVVELKREFGGVAMVGDGVNDAPALAAATVGVAMGKRGTDVALETADVVLMSEDLTRLPEAIRLGRAARRVIGQNIALSLAVKGLVLGLALLGYGSLWSAVAADMGASLLVIGNGLRLLGFRAT